MALAIALDMTNAFDTLPWDQIRRAKDYQQVPFYLKRVIRDSLFLGPGVRVHGSARMHTRKGVYLGVPQGAFLGPLLWNFGYDQVLRSALPPRQQYRLLCRRYLGNGRGEKLGEAIAMANVAVACIVRSIRGMGLDMAPIN